MTVKYILSDESYWKFLAETKNSGFDFIAIFPFHLQLLEYFSRVTILWFR